MITNKHNIPLALAVWAVSDDYDRVPNTISATSLLKPIRQLVLAERLSTNDKVSLDVSDLLASAFGKALHSATELTWLNLDKVKSGLRALGYDEHSINNIKINPKVEECSEYTIPVYIEQRMYRSIEGVTITGKYDIVAEGVLQDYKSTSALSWVYGSNDTNYVLQGSIYRWLDAGQPNPVITEDVIAINYFFTDWSKASSLQSDTYPKQRVLQKQLPLMSIQETENWIVNRIKQIEIAKGLEEPLIVECTDEELWFSNSKYKYYKDVTKLQGKSTRTFNTYEEALLEKQKRNNEGIILESKSEPKRCSYCPVFRVCSQKLKYFPSL